MSSQFCAKIIALKYRYMFSEMKLNVSHKLIAEFVLNNLTTRKIE